MLVVSTFNLAGFGPWTTSLMERRHALEKKLNIKYNDPKAPAAMKSLNRQFGPAHSTLLSSFLLFYTNKNIEALSAIFNLLVIFGCVVQCGRLSAIFVGY